MNKVSNKTNIARCKSSWLFLNENFLVTISYIKKILKIGSSKEIDKTKVCTLVFIILDKFSLVIKPPEDTTVNAREPIK